MARFIDEIEWAVRDAGYSTTNVFFKDSARTILVATDTGIVLKDRRVVLYVRDEEAHSVYYALQTSNGVIYGEAEFSNLPAVAIAAAVLATLNNE